MNACVRASRVDHHSAASGTPGPAESSSELQRAARSVQLQPAAQRAAQSADMLALLLGASGRGCSALAVHYSPKTSVRFLAASRLRRKMKARYIALLALLCVAGYAREWAFRVVGWQASLCRHAARTSQQHVAQASRVPLNRLLLLQGASVWSCYVDAALGKSVLLHAAHHLGLCRMTHHPLQCARRLARTAAGRLLTPASMP
jgi:hypothetical protein